MGIYQSLQFIEVSKILKCHFKKIPDTKAMFWGENKNISFPNICGSKLLNNIGNKHELVVKHEGHFQFDKAINQSNVSYLTT